MTDEKAGSSRTAVPALSVAMLLASFGTSAANVALPDFSARFSASFQEVQWIVLAYLLAVTTVIVSVGRLGDIVGRKRLLLVGIGLSTAASLLCAAAPSLMLLVFARALQGIGASIMMALSVALVGDAVPQSRSGAAMGLLGSMSAVGTAMGPSVSGIAIATFGLPAIFLTNVPVGVVAFLLASRGLASDLPKGGRPSSKMDMPGMFVLALTLAAYSLAMTFGRGSPGSTNLFLLLGAAAGLALLVRIEQSAESPLLPICTAWDRELGSNLAMSMLVSAVMMTTLVVGPFHLSCALGLGAASTGLAMSAGPLVAALASAPAGRLADRLGACRLITAGLAAIGIGCMTIAGLPLSSGVAGYLLPLMLITSGYALFQTANNTAVMANVAADRRGLVSGMLNLSRNLGLITGASMMGAIFAWASGATNLAALRPDEAAFGTRTTFMAAAVLIGLAFLAGFVRLRPTLAAAKQATDLAAERFDAHSPRPEMSGLER